MNVHIENFTAGYSKQIPILFIEELRISDSDKVVLIKGKNSAGKTTCLNSFIKALPFCSGHIYYNNILWNNKSRMAILNSLGFCLIPGLSYGNMTLLENLSLYKLIYRTNFNQFMEEIIHQLDFHEFINQKCDSLSLGKRRIADFIISISHKPQMVFLDEPTAHLDKESINLLESTIGHLVANEEMQFIIATNDDTNFKSLEVKIIQIKDGRAF